MSEARRHTNDGDSSIPRGSNLKPNIRTFKRPRSCQNQKFRCFAKRLTDHFLKVRANLDLPFIEKCLRTNAKALMRGLPRDPCIRAAVANEDKMFCHKEAFIS